MKKVLSLSLIVAALIFAILPIRAMALSPSDISVEISPENPSAGENTTVTLGSYAANLDGTLISWYVNGKKSTSGIGVKSFAATAPAVGSETTIRAVLSLPDGEIEKKIILRPSVMTLLYEATDSYVPPFYKGKAMPIADSEIKVVALPEIKNGNAIINTKNLIYNWKQNYNNAASDSGYGKNYYVFLNDYLQNLDNVGVTVSTVDGKSSAAANINVRASVPQIYFYKNDSLLGTLWEMSLGDGHKITGDEIIVAEPYFISPKYLQSPRLAWSWFINGGLTDNSSDTSPNWLPLKVESGSSGSSTIRLNLESKTNLFGTASKQINVEF